MQKHELLEEICKKLSISNTQFERLKSSYNSMGKWLDEGQTIKNNGGAQIFVQGSMGLGTTIKTINDTDDYDVDLICVIKNKQLKLFPKTLKSIVGERIKENAIYEEVEEGKRCWTFNYESNYHIDILPCVEDDLGPFLISTHKQEDGQYTIHSTNPLGYRNWFYDKCNYESNNIIKKDVEEIKKIQVKFNLQKIVQLLKRHRDCYCLKHDIKEDKPISIIITTLAALCYKSKGNLYEEFIYVIENLMNGFEIVNNTYILKNPVDEKENFADKWNDHPKRQEVFFEWVENLKKDVEDLKNSLIHADSANMLKKMFGENIVNRIYNEYGEKIRQTYEDGRLKMLANGRLNVDKGEKIEKHTFYGK